MKNNGIVYFNILINEENINVFLHVRKYTPSQFKLLLKKHQFQIIQEVKSDIFTKIISYLGVNHNFLNNILKKILIAILSILPIGLLEKCDGKKNQFVRIVKKRG